jgi:hypothetical protein
MFYYVVGIVNCVLGLVFLIALPYMAKNPPDWTTVYLMSFGLGAVFLGGGLYCIISMARVSETWTVQLFTDGFAYKAGSDSKSCGWDGIEALYAQVSTSQNPITDRAFVVVRRGGDFLPLPTLLFVNKVVWDTLQARTLPLLLPTYLEAVRQGEVIVFTNLYTRTRGFADFWVDKDGVHLGKRWIPWQNVGDVRSNLSRLLITDKTESRNNLSYVDPSSTPNRHVLVAMVRELAAKV